jgi:hypothetical protein
MGKHLMHDCKVCKKQVRSDNMTRHLRTHDTPYGRSIREVGVPEKDKKGYNFFMTFVDGHVKDELAKRLADIEEIKQYIICDETGASGSPNNHSHAVVVLNEAINFVNFKKFWDLYELPKYGDIESCKNLRQAFKYCSKEDHLCDFAAIDADYLHHHTTSYLASLRYKTLASTSYPYCRLVGSQRKEFEERFRQWKMLEMQEKGAAENEEVELKRWQKAVINLMKNQDDRQVLWIIDEAGNTGKSFLATYLLRTGDAFVVEGGSTRDLSYAYNDQPYVIFDFCRSQKEFINYHIIEAFKNGRMFSSKYMSSLRIFEPAKVVCFANFLPDWVKLSLDRWMCLEIQDNKVTLVYPPDNLTV